MAHKFLITGAAGFIGGSILTDFLASNNPLLKKGNISAAVRSQEQADALSNLGISVIRLDLGNEEAVFAAILHNDISVVIHTASCIDAKLVLPLISGLGKQRELSGKETAFIHTSGTSSFYKSTGWPYEEFKDTDAIFETEKQVEVPFPVRVVNVAVKEHAEAQGVRSFVVVPPLVYGKGKGAWNKVSVQFPGSIRASISQQKTSRFEADTRTPAVHISDLTGFYQCLISNFLSGDSTPSGDKGYYFPISHYFNWWEVLENFATALYDRGLTKDRETHVWPSDEVAASALSIPLPYVRVLWDSGLKVSTEKNTKLGWNPEWNKDRMLLSLEDEIQNVVDSGGLKSSSLDAMKKVAEKGPSE
ncbi:NAD(P)-binding protein [Cadophora sp. DSE1049]|nr:NAD(P)-binding protein [Cadophora sp. DSE1049]